MGYGKLAAYTVWQVALSSITALRLAIRYLNPKIHQQIVLGAWTMPILTPEDTARAKEKGVTHVALVGPTIGEFKLMSALGDAIAGADVAVTYCLRDPQSVARILTDRPDLSVCYRPVDFAPLTLLWFRRFRPDVVVFVEGMRFPAFAWTSRLFGARNILVNGRCSIRRKLHHRLRAPYFRWLFEPFDTLLLQTERDEVNAAPWARDGQTLRAVGNLKTALPAKPLSIEVVDSLTQWMGPSEFSPLLAAGSTTDLDEEIMVLDAFAAARSVSPCRLLIAPRQLDRAQECIREAERRGHRVSLRTRPQPDADVFVLDTLGELEAAYSLCAAAYIGGSMRGNGHNVLEAAVQGIPVSYGPRRGGFESAQLLCETAGVSERLQGPSDLARHWRQVLEDPNYRKEVQARSEGLLGLQLVPFNETVAELLRLLKTPALG